MQPWLHIIDLATPLVHIPGVHLMTWDSYSNGINKYLWCFSSIQSQDISWLFPLFWECCCNGRKQTLWRLWYEGEMRWECALCSVVLLWCVSCLPNPHNRHSIAHPWGWGIGCLLWIQTSVCVLPQSLYYVYNIYHYIGLCYNDTQLYIYVLTCWWYHSLSFHRYFDDGRRINLQMNMNLLSLMFG